MKKSLPTRIINWLTSGRKTQQRELPPPEERQPPQYPSNETVRRWDSAQTHRLNSAHWANAREGQHINSDLSTHLKTLRARCVYEASNNPWVEGVIRTHSIDVITPSGPTLVVQSSNEAYNTQFKQAWEEWWIKPELAGELSGVDLLRRWNQVKWTKGPVIAQFVSTPDVTSSDVVALRIRDIDPDRLDTPLSLASRDDVQFGVQRDLKTGRPTKFYIRRANGRTDFSYEMKFDDISAEEALFAFESFEADQATGFPRLASCLEEIAQLRDYDTEVLDAARQFANNAMMLCTTSPEFVSMASATMPTGSVEMRRGTAKYAHPGYTPHALNSTQPAANYKEFRFEKLRALGRPVSMPLLLILLSAEESNFSQSRIDVNVFYERGLRAERFWWQSHVLNPILARFSQEVQLTSRRGVFRLPPRPADLKFSWHWEAMPQADEKKHYESKKIKRELGLTTWSHDLAEEGIDRESIKATMEKDIAELESLGLNPTGGEVAAETPQVQEQEQANA